MKEILELSLSPWIVPFTVTLVLCLLYWLLAVIGTIDMDALDLDFDSEAEGASGGFLVGVLKVVNATDVPLMLVLTLLSLFKWMFVVLWHGSLSMASIWWGALLGLVLGFVVACILTRLLMVPLKPLFLAFKKGEDDQEPIFGRECEVVSGELTDKYGRVEVPREKGSPAVVACRLSEGDVAVPKGGAVVLFDFDKEEKIYLAKKI